MKMEPTFPLGLDLDRSHVQRSMEGRNDVSVGKATGGTVSNVNGDVTLSFSPPHSKYGTRRTRVEQSQCLQHLHLVANVGPWTTATQAGLVTNELKVATALLVLLLWWWWGGQEVASPARCD